jgi:hypothetical protein
VLAVFLCAVPTVFAEKAAPHFEKSGPVTIKESRTADGRLRWETVERDFRIVPGPGTQSGEADSLYEYVIHRIRTDGDEGQDSMVTLRRWKKSGDAYDTLMWEIEEEGDAVEWHRGYIRLPKYGCCGGDTAYFYFHPDTGEPFVEATSDLTFIEKNGSRLLRVLSFVTTASVISIDEMTSHDSHTGVFQYGNEYYTQTEVLIVGALDRAENPEITFIDKQHPGGVDKLVLDEAGGSGDDRNITGFSIRLHFWDGFDIVIPVRGDRPDIANATMPEGISLRIRQPLEPDAYLRDIRYVRVEEQSVDVLRLLRNGIFARHGHSFESAGLRAHFSHRSWYAERKGHKVTKDELTWREQKMLKRILEIEAKKK